MASGGLFNRLKIWMFEEVLKSKDLNAEFDNIINHLSPQFISSFSNSIPQMQLQLDPGDLGTENPAKSAAEEIEQLRFVIARITGLPFWYQPPIISLAQLDTLIGSSIPNNRINSGLVRGGGNNQPIFLKAAGSSDSLTLLASATQFVVDIQGVPYIFSSDTTISGMSLAPSSNNTAIVANGLSPLNPLSTFAGEANNTLSTLTLSTTGSQIASLVGQYAAFKVVDGGNTEYFIGFVRDSVIGGTTTITKAFRGFFFGSTQIPVQAIPLTDGDTVTLMKLFYVFATTSLTITTTTVPPVYAASAPTSPALGQYWFDLTTQIWMIYNGSSFVNSNSTFIGTTITDTLNCVAARSAEFFANYKSDNTLIMEFINGNTIRSSAIGQGINVKGVPFSWSENFLEFDMPLHLTDNDGNTSETTNTQYYLYVTDSGQQIFSTVRPYFRIYDLLGYYHRYSPWRLVATIRTDGTPLLVSSSLLNPNQYDGSVIADSSIPITKLVPKSENLKITTTGTLNSSAIITGISPIFGIVPGMIVFDLTNPTFLAFGATVVSVNYATSSCVISTIATSTSTDSLLFAAPAEVGQIAKSGLCPPFPATGIPTITVSNLYISLKTSGRPVIVGLMEGLLTVNSSGLGLSGVFLIRRNGVQIHSSQVAVSNTLTSIPSYVVHTIDFPPPGDMIYDFQIGLSAGAVTASIQNSLLLAYEL